MKFRIHRFAIAVLLGATFLVTGCSERPAESLIRSAKGYLAKNEYKAAIIELKTLLQKAPNTAEARFLLGTALLESGDGFSADVELRKALALNHPKAAVVPALARAMVLQGQLQKLVAEFGTENLPDAAATADLQASLAMAYVRLDKPKDADAALAAALRADPRAGRARVLQARFKAEARDVDGAIALLDTVVADSPTNYEAWQLKGDLLQVVRHDAVAALDAHRNALKIRNDLVTSHASILSILIAQNDMAGAKTQLAQLKAIAPNNPNTKYFEAQLAALNNDYKAAKELSQQLLRVAPDNPKALLMAGAIEFQSGSALQAQNHLSKALQIAPNVIATRRLLAQTYLQAGQSEKAMELLAPLIAASEQPDAQTLAVVAQAYLLNGDAANAEAYFARAAKLDPKDVRSRTALALAQFSKGQTELAFAQLHEIATSDKSTFANMALISTHLQQGNYDGALKAIDELERKQPNTAMAANLRGKIQLVRQDLPAARRSFEASLKIDPLYFPAVVSLAQMDIAEKKPEQAKARFEKLLAVDPKNVRALLAIAGLRADAGATKEEVIRLLAEAVRLNPTEAAPRLLLMDAHFKAKDYKAAESIGQNGVALLPDNPEFRSALGRIQMAAGETNRAIASFKAVAEIMPRSPEPQLVLAQAYLSTNDANASRQSLQRALTISPHLVQAQEKLIALELKARRFDEAMAVARAMQSVPANYAVGLMRAGDIEASQKKWAVAASTYRQGTKLSNAAEFAIKLHVVLLSSRQEAAASKFAAEWVKDNPKSPVFLSYLGNLALSRQRYDEAIVNYRAVIDLQPENATILNNLAWVINKTRGKGALAYAERALALRPNEAAFLDTLAMILIDDGDQLVKAVDLEKKAVELQPGETTFRLNLAKLYIKAGKSALAKPELLYLQGLGEKFAGQAEVTQLLRSL